MKSKKLTPKNYLKKPYARVLIPDGKGYSAKVLEFPGCFAQGDSLEEVYNNLERAAEAWIQSSLERGLEIPPPLQRTGKVKELDVKEMRKKTKDYFKNVSPEQFEKDWNKVMNSPCIFCGKLVKNCKCKIFIER